MVRFASVALRLAGLLVIAGCQTHPAPESPPQPAAVESPPLQNPAAPKPVPFQPVPAEPAPVPSKIAPAPPPAPPPAAPAAPAAPKPASSPPRVPTKPAPAAPPAPPSAAPKPAPLDLTSLEQRLKDTRAIGVFTKLSLKNQVDDLLSELREFHKGSPKTSQSVLRQEYDLLIIKVLSLLQNGDAPLASAIASSREAIWQILMDPNKFSKI